MRQREARKYSAEKTCERMKPKMSEMSGRRETEENLIEGKHVRVSGSKECLIFCMYRTSASIFNVSAMWRLSKEREIDRERERTIWDI